MTEPAKPHQTICDDIAHWARHTPDRPALLTDTGSSVCYGRLGALLDEVGAAVNRAGYGREARIAFVHPGGVRYAILLFGIAGAAAAVPLNSSETEVGFFGVMTDRKVDAVAVLSGAYPEARRAAKTIGIPVLDIVWDADELAAGLRLTGGSGAPVKRSGPADRDDIAIVLGTSGTTAKSKTVPLTHRILRSRVVTRQVHEQITAEDRCLNLNPLFLMSGISTTGVTLLSGSSVIAGTEFRVDRFFSLIDDLRPTWFNGSFAYFKSIINYARTHNPPVRQGQFRYLRPTSGAVDPAVSAEIEQIFGSPVIEMLSSTESGHIAVNPLPPGIRKHGTVGVPVDCEIRILGADGRFLPAGEQGELVVRGRNVMAGYENDPKATAESLFDGWFRTGDLGVLDADGYLTLTGRIKDVINRGGEKFAPAEIERVVALHPDVAEVAAFGVPHETLGEVVAVAVVPRESAVLTEAGVQGFARGRLLPAKVPQYVAVVHNLPRLANGKLRRGELVAQVQARLRQDETPRTEAEPRSETERALRGLWAEVLARAPDTIGRDDDFISLGGDSLRMVELMVGIEARFGAYLPVETLYETSTIAGLAELLEPGGPAVWDDLVEIRKAETGPSVVCIHGGDGDILWGYVFAPHVPLDFGVYGFRWTHALDGDDTTIEAIAARYCDAIAQSGLPGPIVLAGYSSGALIAYEMAQRLRALGKAPLGVVILDLPAPGAGSVWWQIFRHLHELFDSPASEILPLLRFRLLNFLRGRLGITFGRGTRLFERQRDKVIVPGRLYASAVKSYRSRPYDGDAHLVAATDEAPVWRPKRDMGWAGLVRGKLEVCAVKSTHLNLFSEGPMKVWPRAVNDYMRRAVESKESEPSAPR